MTLSNTGIQGVLEGPRERMLLIAIEQAGGQLSRWIHSEQLFRNLQRENRRGEMTKRSAQEMGIWVKKAAKNWSSADGPGNHSSFFV